MGVSQENIRRGGQDTKAHFKFARRVAIYLIHVDLRLSVRDVAALIGVSRETVSNAISDIDDYQDIDPAFEGFLLEVLHSSRSSPEVKRKRSLVSVTHSAAHIVEELAHYINRSDKSATEVFKAAGSSKEAWRQWRMGGVPKIDTLQRVAAVLGKKLVLTDAD